MLHLRIFLFALLGSITGGVMAAKILFISPSITNSIVMLSGRVADVLVKAGHEVVFLIPEVIRSNNANGTQLAKIVRMNNVSDVFEKIVESGIDFFQEPSYHPILARAAVNQALCDFCEAILKRKTEIEALRSENFDLALSDNTELCFVGLAHHLGARHHIWIITGELADAATWIGGIPQPISYVPSFEDTLVGPVMSFSERSWNAFMYITGRLLTAYQFGIQNELFRKYGNNPHFPNLEDLARNSPVWFVVRDEFISPAVPTLDKVVSIAGVGIQKERKLSEEMLALVMRGKRGTIFFSLGSLTPTANLCVKRRKALFDAFSTFPDYQFIVKVSKEDEMSKNLTRNISNIQLVHWVPQTDLLGHPHVKLFISHGGMNSVFESAIRATPMITIPLFFDQFRNAKAVEYRGYGILLERTQITVENVRSAITNVLNNPKYKERAQRLAKLYWSKPNRPDEEIVKWTNFVLENGDLPELIPEGVNLNVIQYFCIDVFLVAFAFTIIFIYIIYYFLKFLVKFFFAFVTFKKQKTE